MDVWQCKEEGVFGLFVVDDGQTKPNTALQGFVIDNMQNKANSSTELCG